MREILLSKKGKNRGKYVALVDDDVYENLNIYNWRCTSINGYTYAVRSFKDENGKCRVLSMHREIMKNPKGFLVDHWDRNGLNNQKINLRVSTKSQNNSNRRSMVGSVSKYLGVSLYKKTKKWVAFISHSGLNKNIHLGYHNTEEGAALAYNDAALKYHGEFANLNIIQNI